MCELIGHILGLSVYIEVVVDVTGGALLCPNTAYNYNLLTISSPVCLGYVLWLISSEYFPEEIFVVLD